MVLEDKEVLHKFLFLHLTPSHLKNKVSTTLSLGLVDFKRYVMDMCDADLRKTRDVAREINYFNKPQQKHQITFQKRNEPQTRQVNYGYGRPKARLTALTIKTIVTEIEIR